MIPTEASDFLEYYRLHHQALDVLVDEEHLFVLALVQRTPGLNLSQLKQQVEGDSEKLISICRKLETAGLIALNVQAEYEMQLQEQGDAILRLLFAPFEPDSATRFQAQSNQTIRMEVSRRKQLVACLLGMIAISGCQYAWTLFVTSLISRLHVEWAAVQGAFSVFVFAQVFSMLLSAYPVDRFGPRSVVTISGILVGLGWVGSGAAGSVQGLYLSQMIAGLGAGAAYGACIGTAVKWFPDKRGLCAGLVAGAYVLGAAITGWPISLTIHRLGDASAFIVWGIVNGIIVILAAQWLMPAPANETLRALKIDPPQNVFQSAKNYTPIEMLKTRLFYVLYSMMTLGLVGGLLITAHLEPMATYFNLRFYVVLGGSSLGLVFFIQRISNFLSRIFFGGVSDRIGRYNTMLVAFGLQILAIVGLVLFPPSPEYFALSTAVLLFAWGEIFAIYPSIIADIYGTRFATTNYGIQYTSKFFASLLAAPGAAWLYRIGGPSWRPVFLATGLCSAAACALALAFRKSITGQMIVNHP